MTKQPAFSVSGQFLERKIDLNKADSGLTRHFTNDVTSEPDVCLQGQRGSRAFNLMRKKDSIVGGIILSYQNPIQSANWSIEEIKDATPKETEITKILNEWFFKRNNFDELLTQILGMLPIGFSYFERFFQNIEIEGTKYMLPILRERVQQSIRKIDYKAFSVEQQTTEGNLVNIPFNDSVFFSFRKEANDARGVSLLRQAYDDYQDKKEIKRVAKKGIARSMLGLPVGTVPKGTSPKDKSFLDFQDLIIELGDRGYNGLSDSAVKQEDYEIELLTATFDIKGLKDYISYIDNSMVMSVLTQFITLGQNGGGGSYSLGRDQSDMFLDGLKYIIKYIEQTFSQNIIHLAVSLNWADVDPLKFNLRGTNLNKKASKEFAETLKTLIDSGTIQIEPQDEVRVRKMYNLPEIDLKEREKKEEEEKELESEITKEGNNDNSEEETEEDIKKEEKGKIKLSEIGTTSKQRKRFQKQEVDKLAKFSRASLQLISDEFSKTIRRQLNKGTVEAQGLKDLQINNVGAYKKRLSQKLAGISMDAWKNALRNSKGKLKLAEIKASDLPTKALTAYVLNQSDTMAEKQVNDLRENAILMANTQASKGLSVNNTMAMVEDKSDDYIDNKNIIEGGLVLAIVQAMNYGEMAFYNSIENDLWGFTFANDIPKTEICQSLVGKTYPKSSSELDIIQPPLHFRCDSFLIPIYKADASEKPEFDNFIPTDRILEQKTI